MRIAIVHIRLLYRGGLETRLWSYMRYLQAQGHDVTVIVHKVGAGIQVPDGIRLLQVRIGWVPKVFKSWVFDNRLGKIVARERFDFVLSLGRNSHQDAVLLPGNHLGFLRAVGKRWHSLSDRLQILLDRRAYNSPGVILACSEMMRDEVVELYHADAQKIKILYPPTDTSRFHTGLRRDRVALRERFGMHPEKLSMVLVSASHSRKGLPLLLAVFARLVDEPFELLVAGQEEVATNLPNVRGIGYVQDTEALFAAADFTVLPALYEPFGQVVSESILCGTPVLLSAMVGAKSAISANEGIVIPDLKVETWLATIRSLRSRRFEMEGDYASRNGIRLDAHIEQILACAPLRT